MKRKILKIATVIVLLMTLTMVNFISVGMGLVSYAQETITTNHSNVEFKANLADNNKLNLEINVKKEGYFNGEITLENSNFIFKTSESSYVNNIEDHKITLNQINAGTTASIEVEIEQNKDDLLDVGLLSAVSQITLDGTYRDSTEKDIHIEATRGVKLEYTENNQEENVAKDMEIITNKILTINGEEKRVVQVSMNMGLSENNYPIKEIKTKVTMPELEGERPDLVGKANFNTMTYFNYEYNGQEVEITFTNEPNEQNQISWKKQGLENVVLTFIYDKDIDLTQAKIEQEQKVTLYNNKELNTTNEIVIGAEEKDAIVEIESQATENTIYKGKLYAGIDRSFETKSTVKVNLANVSEAMNIREEVATYVGNNQEIAANVIFQRTTLTKESFDKVLGKDGKIIITNQNGEEIGTIDSNTAVEGNNFVVDYTGKEPTKLNIQTTKPVKEGDLEFTHTKVIKSQEKTQIQNVSELKMRTNVEYGTGVTNTQETTIKLEESKTEARIELNKDSLSTITSNNVEIKAILKTNHEQYELYRNPVLTIDLPEQVQNVQINSINVLYGNGLNLRNYEVNGRTIRVYLEGEQKEYTETTLEGANVIINANLDVDRKSATSEEQITLTYTNENAVNYANNATSTANIKVVAPKNMTAIHSIQELSVETFGEEESQDIMMEKGVQEKQYDVQIEIINNESTSIENVQSLGVLPTDSTKNNMGIHLVQGITINGSQNGKVYYTENENATEDLTNPENGWTENLDLSRAKKYLLVLDQMNGQESVKVSYRIVVPENLEYNQEATTGYQVTYTNSETKVEDQVKATELKLQTGIGPNVETKLTAFVGREETTGNVRNGEVIRYTVQVSNTGTEDATNITVKGQVPEGTTLVEPEQNYEYTGSSYYQELEDREYQTTIETLKAGETVTKEYEVRVNSQTQENITLKNTCQVQYGEVTKQTNEVTLTTAKGTLRVSVKQVTDRDTVISEGGTIQYYAIIENISNERQDNIKVRTNLPEGVTVEQVQLITGMEHKDVSDDDLYDPSGDSGNFETREITEEELIPVENDEQYQELEYSEEMDIGSLEPGENKVVSYDLYINQLNDENQMIAFDVTIKDGNNTEYRSNSQTKEVNDFEIDLSMTATPEERYVNAGDTIEYIITVQNKTNARTSGLTITDDIPSQLTVNKVTVNDQDMGQIEGNHLEISYEIAPNATAVIKITTSVNYSASRQDAEAITNTAIAKRYGEEIARTAEITHIIQANGEEQNPGDNDVSDNDIAQGNRTITGVAWYDENANGQMEANEQTLNNIKVRLLNVDTNNLVKDTSGNTLEATTNDNGVYLLDKIGNGRYIVIFDYDTTKYNITTYKKEGVSESENSDVMLSDLTINGESQKVAATDIIQINNENISDMNLGLIELKNFDLKLDKYVSRIVIQDSQGTTVREYNNETTAKFDFDAKRLNGASVVVEYKIVVTNQGEVVGYARRIADYVSTELKFSSELNKDWYQSGNILYNASLANEEIQPGESKEITLTLTKTMTEENTGLIPNTAEIVEDYNELGLSDSNSTPGNNTNGENDQGSAEVILTIRTGAVVYTSIAIVIIAVLAVVAVIIIKKKKQFDKKEN